MVEENISQEFRLKHVEHFLILLLEIKGCISISSFASLLGVSIGITSSAIGLNICEIAAGNKKYEPIKKRGMTKQYC